MSTVYYYEFNVVFTPIGNILEIGFIGGLEPMFLNMYSALLSLSLFVFCDFLDVSFFDKNV